MISLQSGKIAWLSLNFKARSGVFFLFSRISLTIEINRAIISILDISIVEVLDERKSAQVRPLLQSGNIGNGSEAH